MHELSLADAVYRTCRAEIERRGGGRLRLATVRVGALAGVEPRLLEYAWEAVVGRGRDVGARIEIRWMPATQRCRRCGPVAARQPGAWLRLCPACESPLLIEGGGELEIGSIEFDEPEPATVPVSIPPRTEIPS